MDDALSHHSFLRTCSNTAMPESLLLRTHCHSRCVLLLYAKLSVAEAGNLFQSPVMNIRLPVPSLVMSLNVCLQSLIFLLPAS